MDIREIIRKSCATSTAELIGQLNPKILGWANYYRHVVAKHTFSIVDEHIFKALWKWIKRRHPEKSNAWRKNKYFRSQESQNWIFHAKIPSDTANTCVLDLIRASKISIKRHVKIKREDMIRKRSSIPILINLIFLFYPACIISQSIKSLRHNC